MMRQTMATMDRDRVLETATLDSEISMSVAATDETRDLIRHRQPPFFRGISRPSAGVSAGDDEMGDSEYFGADMAKSLSERRCGINVEPVIFLFAIAIGLITTIQPLFLYWARCIEIFKDYGNMTIVGIRNVSDLCARLSEKNNSFYQNTVEKDISTTKVFLQIASGIPTLISAPTIGVWSDGSGGRRRPLLLGLFGLFIYTLLQFVSTLTYKWMNVYIMQYVAEVAIGCTGGIATLFMASFAIVTDDSRHQMLPGSTSVPLRIGIASALQSIGIVIGSAIASIFTISPAISVKAHEDGYVKATAASFAVTFIAIFYAFVCVKETHQHLLQLQRKALTNRRRTYNAYHSEASAASGSRSCWKCFTSFIYDIVEVVAVPRHGWARFCLNLSICFVFVEFLAIDNQLLFLLVKRYPFEWSDTTFTYYSTGKNIALSFGMVLFPIVISKVSYLGKDSLLIMIGVFAGCLQFLIFSLAYNSGLIFIAGGFSFLAGAIAPGYRSFLPRMVAKEETARLFAAFSIVMVVSPILSALVFNNIFNATIDVWPGFAFLVGSVLQLIVFIGQIVVHCLMWPQWNSEREERLQRLNSNNGDNTDAPQSPLASDTDAAVIINRSISNTAIHSTSNSPEISNDVRRPLLV